jgi:GNAT superfamily N-acetyltransferase
MTGATLRIRRARSADLDLIADLQAQSIMTLGVETYGVETCEAWARMGRQVRHTLLDSGTFFVAERDDVLMGVAGWVEDSRELDCAWARYVFVAPEASRLGIGRALMDAIERSVTAAGRSRLQLWSSLNAEGFYRKLGYQSLKTARWPVAGDLEMEHWLMEKRLTGVTP